MARISPAVPAGAFVALLECQDRDYAAVSAAVSAVWIRPAMLSNFNTVGPRSTKSGGIKVTSLALKN